MTSIPETTLTNNTATATLSGLQPDFTTSVTLPANAPAGTTVTGTVTFTNSGNATATFTATITINGSTTVVSFSLAPNESRAVTISVPVFSTGASVQSTVTNSSIPESNTQNNTATGQVTTVPVDVSTTIASPGNLPVGATTSATVTFTNNGSATVTFTPSFTINGVTVPGTQSFTLNPSGTPGASTTTQAPVLTVQAGGNTVTAGVGVTSIPETTLTNNTATVVLNALAPNASVSGRVWLDVNSDRIYQPGTDVDLAGWRVELLNSSGVVVGTATTSVTGSYIISGQVPSNVAGTYTIRFRNPSGEIIGTTPFNQSGGTVNGNPSTGTTSNVVTGTRTVGNTIGNITLYAGDNVVEQNLPIDPSGVVYDSVTRRPVAGAQVTLIGPNGSPVPAACIVQGASTITTDATGVYRFDLFSATPLPAGCVTQTGVYSLRIVPPAQYNVPVATQGGVAAPGGVFTPPNTPGVEVPIQPNALAPSVGVNGNAPVGSVGTQYFLQFNINPSTSAGVIHNHIPLDPFTAGVLTISKVGDRTSAEIGDTVRYTIRLRNTGQTTLTNLKVQDLLPAGFRYILGTSRLNNSITLADPAGGVGRSLTFALQTNTFILAGNSDAILTYLVRVGVGAQQGDGINRANAVYDGTKTGIVSATAQYKVQISGGLFSNDGCIIGKVYVDCDGNHMQNNESGSRELGIPGVRLLMLDGTNIVTDSEGKYSICGVKAQTHVIKVDRTTMPKGSRLLPSSNRNAGVGDSLFVDLKAGELARADFIEGSCTPEVLDQVKARRAQAAILAPEKETPPDFKIDNRPLQVQQQILPGLRPETPAAGNAGGNK